MGIKARRAAVASVGVRKSVDGYIAGLDAWQAAVIKAVRAIIREEAPNAAESIKWGQPVYESNGPFCYVQAYANQVNFGFWRGVELDDATGILQGDGAKMRHIKLRSLDDIDVEVFGALVSNAIELNRSRGNPTR